MNEKTIIITNGVGEENILNGSYEVSANVNGYNNTSINPTSVDIVDGTNTYAFTIAAEGSLTLHVTEDGTSSGVAVAGATFIRTDASGNEYGASITTDTNGDAVFENVPFAETGAPVIYFKQTASDGAHEFSSSIQNTTLTTSTETLEIQNAVPALRTISLLDANYQNLPVDAGTIILN